MARTLLAAVLLIVAVAAPAVTAVTYTVGDAAGWNVLGNDAYDNWADNKTFYVGDILVFNFINGTHDVAEVTESAYDTCNTTSPISLATISTVRITLTTPGEHHYICTFSSHCSRGQKLSIDVLANSSAPAPPTASSPTPSPSTVAAPTPTPSTVTPTPTPSTVAPTPTPSTVAPTPTPTPTRTPVTYTVGDAAGWNVLTEDAYDTWADNKKFYVGDTLVFNFVNGTHDVAEVTEAAYDSCNTASPISLSTSSPVSIKLTTAGDHYYICTFSGHCSRGQKLSIDVLASSTTTPSGTTTAPPPSDDNSASSTGVTAIFSMILSVVVAVFMF